MDGGRTRLSAGLSRLAGGPALALGAAIWFVCVMLGAARAQPVEAPTSYGGDIWTRPRLSGNWDGLRDHWSARGIVIDADVTNIGQAVASGGREKEAAINGRADFVLNLDSGKAGLWPGGFLKVHAQTSYGKSVNKHSGAISAPNGVAIFPVANESDFAVPNVTLTQFLTPWLGVYVGKVETLDGDANEFADDNRTKFLNLGFETALTNAFVPQSALGGGLILLPWDGAMLVAGIIDPNGDPTEAGFDNVFTDGVLVTAEGRATVNPFGLVGHQLVGLAWSDKNHLSLSQDPSNLGRFLLQARFPRLGNPGPALKEILERFFPGLLVPTAPLNSESHTWSLYYNFDQFLWSPEGRPDAGIGVFGRVGFSDGKANPVKRHYSLGIGGKHIVPGRPRDTFGIGWSRLEFSDDFVAFLRGALNLGLKHEDSFEAYYTFSLMEWLSVTADIQIIDPALNKKLTSSGTLKEMDTAIVFGLRTMVRF